MDEQLLRPIWVSNPKGWGFEQAAHLLRRAGFGGTPAEIARAIDAGPARAVAELLNYKNIPDRLPPLQFGALSGPYQDRHSRRVLGQLRKLSGDERKALQQLRQVAMRTKDGDLRIWWLDRMVRTQRPLEEKMTLFFHGLFVSSITTVRSAYMLYQQNQLFRKHAVGNLKELALEVSKDPAMLVYLNNDQNKKAHANENYARELMELFTLGIGNYTEKDVRENARAFTGWTHFGEEFVNDVQQHDDGVKTFLGHTGNFDGTDIINIIFEQPAAATHAATKLLKFFATDDDPPEPVVKLVADTLRRNRYEIAPALHTLFGCTWFYSEDVMHRQIKSPVVLVVGSLRLLGVNITEPQAVENSLKIMGQELFDAPTVKGWDGGRSWINTSTLFARYNLPAYLVTGRLPQQTRRGADADTRRQFTDFDSGWDWQLDLAESRAVTSDQVVDYYAWRLIQDRLRSDKLHDLVAFLNGTGDARTHVFDPVEAGAGGRLRSLVQLLMAMPEYQIC